MPKLLRRIVQEINTADNFVVALSTMVKQVRDAVGAQACTLFLKDKAKEEYILIATSGLNIDVVGCARVKLHEGLVGLIAEKEEPLNLEDASIHPHFHCIKGSGEERFKGFLGVPIIHHRQVLGVLVIQQREKQRFEEPEEAFLTTMSAQLAG